jgi:sugar phosphate isomerase/epimerase
MRLGLGSYLFRWAIGTPSFQPSHPLTPIDLVRRTAGLSVGVLQIADHPALETAAPRDLAALRSVARDCGICLEIGASGATPARLARYLGIAVALDATLVRLVLDGVDARPSLEEATRILKAAAPGYREAGVTLAVENHFALASAELVRLVETVNDAAVGVCLDTANSIGCREWPLETVNNLAPYAVSLHLKDCVVMPHPEGIGVVISGAPLGQGCQSVGTILEAMCAAGREVTVILEHWLPRQDDEATTLRLEREWAQQSVAAAREYLAQLGT